MSKWATEYIERLKHHSTIDIRPKGNSMKGRISSGQLCTISSDISEINKNDIVLCCVKGNHYLHLVTGVRKNQYQISNNKGFVNGWITINSIYGKVTNVV